MQRILLLAAFFLTATFTLSAQAAVHFDRPYHVAGEVSWFSFYPGPTTPPKVRVSISDPTGKVLDYFFLSADENGQINGFYRWPFAAETGYYSLAFDAFATNQTVQRLGRIEHAVYSDKRVEPDPAAGNTKEQPIGDAKGLTVNVAGNKVALGGLNGDAYSVSVYNVDVTGARSQVLGEVGEAVSKDWLDTLFYEAKIELPDGQPVETNLLPVFDPATYTFGFSKTGADGTFILQSGRFSGNKSLQVRSLEGYELRPEVTIPSAGSSRRRPVVTKEVADYIDLARRRRKIYQLFATVETEVDAKGSTQERRKFTVNRDFNVQDYKQFPDMYTFFKEVGGELRVRLRKENYSAQLYNAPNQRFFEDTPLYIVDGKLTRNSNYINTLSPSDVSYLAYFYDNKALRRDFPALGNNGVVQIEMVRPSANFPQADASGIFTVKGLQPEASFQPRDAAASSVPALSPLLLWATGGGQATASLALPATDDFGNYQVVVVARGKDGSLRRATTTLQRNVK